MKIPYYIQGAFFAPTLIGILFLLKITCPAGAGQGCFADPFLAPVFMPLTVLYKIFGNASILISYEPLFVLIYWILVGVFVGLLFDLLKAEQV